MHSTQNASLRYSESTQDSSRQALEYAEEVTTQAAHPEGRDVVAEESSFGDAARVQRHKVDAGLLMVALVHFQHRQHVA
jgi:hypothetical protein